MANITGRLQMNLLLGLPFLFLQCSNIQAQRLNTSGSYIIVEKQTSRCLDVFGGIDARSNGVRIIRFDCHGADNQQWKLMYVGGGFYKIQALHSRLFLAVEKASKDNEARVIQWQNTDGFNQLWSFEDAGDGYYHLKAKHSGKCLDVYGGQGAIGNGERVQQFDCHSGDNQKWQLRRMKRLY